jgi:hypothetical protein
MKLYIVNIVTAHEGERHRIDVHLEGEYYRYLFEAQEVYDDAIKSGEDYATLTELNLETLEPKVLQHHDDL